MNDDLRNVGLYRKLVPSKVKLVLSAAISLILILTVGAFGVFGCIQIYREQSKDDFILLVLFLLVFFGVLVFISARGFLRQKRQYDGNSERLSRISKYELERIEEQLESSEYFYKTLYLLDGYMYVPKIKLLIRYTDIRGFKTIIHSTNGMNDGIKIEIADSDGVKYCFGVKKWKDFFMERPVFLEKLDEKIQNCVKS